MSHYRSNLRDIEFTLFDVLGRDAVLGAGPYEDIDTDTARSILTEIDRLARNEIAASYVAGDQNPPEFDPATGTARLPASVHASFRSWREAEWWRLEIPEGLGGQPCPPSLRWAASELVLGANPALFMYASGPRFAHSIWRNGTERQRHLARLMVDRHWAATMVLTEPDAGSDVGAGKAKAFPQADGSWHLEGVKRFVTAGEHDLTENIVHLVLARPSGVDGAGGPGTKGLSLFLVPKYHFDWETGDLGERNGVRATNVEHKMGLKVSTTCELTFGGDTPAVGYLLGEVHNGIRQMFQIIEYARMMVGTKAIATLSSGYLNALDYAKTRVQGADLTRATDKSAPRVTITHHPDVRRSLLTQKAYAEGLRALVLYTATVQDAIERAEFAGEQGTDAARSDDALNDLLLPIVKGYGSERAWVLLGTESLQTFGGSGFLQDYPLEQYVRDAKIDTLYEGTTAIQGLDLFFRKIVRDNGQALGRLAGQIQEFVGSEEGNGRLKEERGLLGKALEDVQAIVGSMVGDLLASQPKAGTGPAGGATGDVGEAPAHGSSADADATADTGRGADRTDRVSQAGDSANLYKVGQNTSRLLLALGDLVCGWLLLRQAEVAHERLGANPTREDTAFYEGKIAAARWFARQVLPKLSAERAIAEATDNDLMALPEESF